MHAFRRNHAHAHTDVAIGSHPLRTAPFLSDTVNAIAPLPSTMPTQGLAFAVGGQNCTVAFGIWRDGSGIWDLFTLWDFVF